MNLSAILKQNYRYKKQTYVPGGKWWRRGKLGDKNKIRMKNI